MFNKKVKEVVWIEHKKEFKNEILVSEVYHIKTSPDNLCSSWEKVDLSPEQFAQLKVKLAIFDK